MSVPNLADFEAHLTGGGDESEKDDILESAISIVEGLVGPLETATVTERHRGISSDVLVLRQMPVASLTAISTRYGATTAALTVGDYELDADSGLLRAASGAGFRGDFDVTYTVGRADVPVAIREAILIIAAHLWETQRVPGASFGRVPGFGGSEADVTPVAGQGYAIPNRAMSLLEPYLLGPTIA